MSIGCGTLCSPAAFCTGTKAASRSNGRQHTLPISPTHSFIKSKDVKEHWGPSQPKSTSRLWGAAHKTSYGGEERLDGQPDHWLHGDYWNVDSNIRRWNSHQVKRNMASANHDVHRHDQIRRAVIGPHPHDGPKHQRIPARQCISGVVSPDCCFLETWGFDLGMRDRQGMPITSKIWRPPGGGAAPEHFRSLRSYDRNVERMAESFRIMRKTMRSSGSDSNLATAGRLSISSMLKPEDISGDEGVGGGVFQEQPVESRGMLHGTRCCYGWDDHAHAVLREGAKMSHSVHSPAARAHKDFPYIQGRLAPASRYRRNHSHDQAET
jgi:hypothetical protein